MDQYEVVLHNIETKNRWTMLFKAESFAHAEHKAQQNLTDIDNKFNEIIAINKDYGDE